MTIGNLIGIIVYWATIIFLNVQGYNCLMECNINGEILLETRIFILILVVLDFFACLVLIQWFTSTKLGMSVCSYISKFLNKTIF